MEAYAVRAAWSCHAAHLEDGQEVRPRGPSDAVGTISSSNYTAESRRTSASRSGSSVRIVERRTPRWRDPHHGVRDSLVVVRGLVVNPSLRVQLDVEVRQRSRSIARYQLDQSRVRRSSTSWCAPPRRGRGRQKFRGVSEHTASCSRPRGSSSRRRMYRSSSSPTFRWTVPCWLGCQRVREPRSHGLGRSRPIRVS